MNVQTKLSGKLRKLAGLQPKREARLNDHANRLDRAVQAGTVTREYSMIYRAARLAYCEASGRAYDFGATTDLDMVPVE